MKTKNEYIQSLWEKKHTSDIILVLHELVDNAYMSKEDKKGIFAVMNGIITYTDRGDKLFDHHREYLKKVWDDAWSRQRDSKVKDSITEWLK